MFPMVYGGDIGTMNFNWQLSLNGDFDKTGNSRATLQVSHYFLYFIPVIEQYL